MKTIITLILIMFGSATMAEPLIMIGISRKVVCNYMDHEPGYQRTHYSKDSVVYHNEADNLTFVYIFVPNDLGLSHTCIEVLVRVPDADEFISDRLSNCRFRLEPFGYVLNNPYANEPTVCILRNGNTLKYKYHYGEIQPDNRTQ
jgi:hypothetical protein